MDEKSLAKILEYGKISEGEALKQISALLELDLYYEEENNLYTLSNEFMVLDITGNECSLIFVDEHLNSKITNIRKYLLHFIQKKHIFLYILKYIIGCTNGIPATGKEGTLQSYKCICSCIFTGKYCKVFDLNSIRDDFNIFTHMIQDLPLEYYFYTPNTAVLPQIEIRGENTNIAKYIPLEKFDRDCFDIFIGNVFYEEGDVKVIRNSVYLKNERQRIASLAFLKGCTLKESLRYANILEK